ncbi:ribonuclease G and E-like protein [Exiguobacterium sp. SH3S2]|uniref:ribonuclease E/G n=1 Tax=unclassified Exiguobacterium TaxID=2644629 RepID=UPI00103F2286|nr:MULTISPECIES: ribonuclease E/G [unclassified Exiguobacterium]TCI43332.1 ribonuclease G and E-like protein [Exiguobacterium sp. SH3S3]TCI59178.1 ribonuclease G and E-like protein [Exiguobacterium sp. SH3S2]
MKLIYERTPSIERAMLVDGERLLEVEERFVDQLSVGTILEAAIERIHPSLGAAFLVNGETTFFLPIAETLRALAVYPEVLGIGQAAVVGEKRLVQVTKEGIGGKHHKVTENIRFGGRYLVYFPYGRRQLFSRKLDLATQDRLSKVFTLNEAEGVLFRTESGQASPEALREELALLRARAADVETARRGQDELLCEQFVRRHSVESVLLNDKEAQERLKRLDVPVERHIGKGRMKEAARLDTAIEKLENRVVWLEGGSYVLVEQVETMTVIDVNSGKNVAVKDKGRAADTINEAALYAIMEQLRLRNIGGMVVIDFLRGSKDGQDRLLKRMKELGARDPRRVEVYGFTRMGLFELSRERTGRSIQDRMTYNGAPSKLAVFSRLERTLMELDGKQEAVVLSLPTKWQDGAWDASGLHVFFIEGEPDVAFHGTLEECENFVSRH